MKNKCLFFCFVYWWTLLMTKYSTVSSMPLSWDIQAMYPLCRAWNPFAQAQCGNCCSMALATALSARECIRDARDTLFSAQQIWDCAGSTIANCNEGSSLSQIIDAMSIGSRSSYFLLPNECSSENSSNTNANITRCLQSFASCPLDAKNFRAQTIDASVLYKIQLYNGPADYNALLATYNMMSEIMNNGPVISVMSISDADLPAFQNLTGNTIFIPQALLLLPFQKTNNNNSLPITSASTMMSAQIIHKHCIVVYGWGQVCSSKI